MADAWTNSENTLPQARSIHVGGNKEGWVHITTTATIPADQINSHFANAASTDYAITLPRLSAAKGRIYTIRCIEDLGTGVVTVNSAGDDPFRNFTHVFNATGVAGAVVRCIADEYGWDVIGTRVVNDSSMNGTPGYVGETVWNLDDTINYTCSVASTTPSGAATWVANT